MKKLLVLMMVAVMAVGMCACGDTDSNPETENFESERVNSNQDLKISYEDSMDLGGLDIRYDETVGFFTDSPYGFEYIFESNSIGFYICDYEDAAETWDQTIENSQPNIFGYLFDAAGFGLEIEQNVESKEEVTLNGIEWLKVTGTFKNLESDNEFEREYVAYYAMREMNMPDGTSGKIPFYLVGVPQAEATSDTLEAFVDDFAGHITEVED